MPSSIEIEGVITRDDFQYFMKELDPEYLCVLQGSTKLLEARLDSFTTLLTGVILRYHTDKGPHVHLIPFRRMHYLDIGQEDGKKQLNICLVP